MGWDHKLYASSRWEKRSEFHRKQHPLCVRCEARGIVQEANLAHHIEPHRDGDEELKFWFGKLESLCYDCHRKEHGVWPMARPFKCDIGADGWPIDGNHPVYRSSKDNKSWSTPKQSTKRSTKS
jgi:hypothetical protein